MLAHFQQALADLVAAPDRCQAVRDGDVRGLDGYDLTAIERTRLVAIANHSKMAANCAVYRSNRLTPIVINLPDTCAALGGYLREIVDRFWAEFPTQHFVHFLVETERFVSFVRNLPDGTLPVHIATAVNGILEREAAVVSERLVASLT